MGNEINNEINEDLKFKLNFPLPISAVPFIMFILRIPQPTDIKIKNKMDSSYFPLNRKGIEKTTVVAPINRKIGIAKWFIKLYFLYIRNHSLELFDLLEK